MYRSLLLACLSAAPAAAQLDAPSARGGFFVGAHLQGVDLEEDTDADREPLTGTALGVELGYGFSSGLALFLNADAGGRAGETEGMTQVDLGARMNFGAGRRALVPFMEAAVTGAVLDEADGVTLSGGGVTVGGGVRYFLTRRLSLDAGVRATRGAFSEREADGVREEIEDRPFVTSRVALGATWHP